MTETKFLAEAMTEVRTEALVKLALVKADDTLEILRLQAIAGCLSDVRAWLEAKILATGEKDGGVSATTKPTE